MHKFDDRAFISACESDGLLVDEHKVEVEDKEVITRVYRYSGDSYVHVLLNGDTLAFEELNITNHSE